MANRTWVARKDFSLAAYFERLVARPSFARVLIEARPYFTMFPFRDDMPARFRAG